MTITMVKKGNYPVIPIYDESAKNSEKDLTSHAGQDIVSGTPAMLSSSKIKKNNKTPRFSPLYKEQDDEEEGGDTE